MFVIPVSSDAPLRYFPWGTVALISVNTVLYACSALGLLPPVSELSVGYALHYGTGLHPVQWVTSNFLHAGWTHLLGNMMFLWVFGALVEGMVGWRLFFASYFGLGLVECMIEQACLTGPGFSLGSSSIILGLLAMAMVWVPKNEIEFAYGIFLPMVVNAGTFAVPIVWVGIGMLGIQAALAWWFSFSAGSELLHLLGAVLGMGWGSSMLKAGLVDCQGWDLWHVLRGSTGDQKEERSTGSPGAPADAVRLGDGRDSVQDNMPPEIEQQKRIGRKVRTLTKLRRLIRHGKANAALEELQRISRVMPDFELPPRDLLDLASLMHGTKRWREEVGLYEQYIQRFPREADRIRLLVADVMLKHQKRPSAALRHLKQVQADRLHVTDRKSLQKLTAQAESLIDAGVIELEGRSWN